MWSFLPSEGAQVWNMQVLVLLLWCSDTKAQELCKIAAPPACRLEAKNTLGDQGSFSPLPVQCTSP